MLITIMILLAVVVSLLIVNSIFLILYFIFIKGSIRILIDDGILINNSLNVIVERYTQLTTNATINSEKVNKFINNLTENEEKKNKGWKTRNADSIARTENAINSIRKHTVYSAPEEEQKEFESSLDKPK